MSERGGAGGAEWPLEHELRQVIGGHGGLAPRASQARYQMARTPFAGRLTAFASTRAAAVGAALCLTAAGGVYAMAAASTGSANPLRWGQQVRQTVQACKEQVRSGSAAGEAAQSPEPATSPRNVGQCVSSFASSKPSPSPSTGGGQGSGGGSHDGSAPGNSAFGHSHDGADPSHSQNGGGAGADPGHGQGHQSHGAGQGHARGPGAAH